jgi:hypothetical protein
MVLPLFLLDLSAGNLDNKKYGEINRNYSATKTQRHKGNKKIYQFYSLL